MIELDPLTFKFRWMEEGNVSGYIGLDGSFDGKKLKLDEKNFPIESIFAVGENENVLSLVVADEEDYREIAIVVLGTKPAILKSAIDTSLSSSRIAEEQKRLIEAGQGDSFRSETCPHCHASISLSKFADSPQCYCEYCDTLFTIRDQHGSQNLIDDSLSIELETKYRICDECEMYSFPRQFTIFYFIFLVYFIHFDSRKTVRCPGCMRKEAWKMLFGNIFGLLGLPLAFIQLWRSYRSRIESGPLKGLDDANSLARRGKVEKALDRYDALMDNLPINAGIKFNIGSGLLTKGDVPHAETMFLLALEDCGNYEPALNGLHFCYRSLEKTAELAELEYQMGIEEMRELQRMEQEMELESNNSQGILDSESRASQKDS